MSDETKKPKYTDDELRKMYDEELALKAEYEKSLEEPEPVQAEEDTSNEHVDTAIDTAHGFSQGLTLNTADEMVGLANAMAQTGAGRKDKSFSDLMQEGAEPLRTGYATAKERSPIATTIGEVGGAVVSPTNKIPGVASIPPVVREMAEGAISGAMSKDKTFSEMDGQDAQDVGLSTATAGVMHTAVSGVKKAISEGSNVIRARSLGAGAREFGEVGVKRRTQIAKTLEEQGLFSGTSVTFDPHKLRFVSKNVGKFGASDLDLPAPNRLRSRVGEAVESIGQLKEQQFGNIMRTEQLDPKEIRIFLKGAVQDYVNSNPKYHDSLVKGNELVDTLMETLQLPAGPHRNPTIAEVDALKSKLYDYTTYGKAEGDLPDAQILYQNAARQLKDLINKKMDKFTHGSRFKELNEAQSNFLTAKFDLDSRLDGINAAKKNHTNFNPLRMAKELLTGEDGLRQANFRDALDKTPLMLRQMGAEGVQDTGGVLMRRSNNEGQEIPYAPEAPMAQPSVMVPAKYRNLPEQLMETPLKRDSQWLFQNKELVFAKLFQFAPEVAGGVVAAAKKGPEAFKANLSFLMNSPDPMIQDTVSGLFEDNKYNMMDGEILDPKKKMLAMDDVRWNQNIGSVQKAKLLNKIQRGEKLV